VAEGLVIINPLIRIASSLKDTYLRCLVHADLVGVLLRQKKYEQANEILKNLFNDVIKIEDPKTRAEVFGSLLDILKKVKCEGIKDLLDQILKNASSVLSKRHLANMYVLAAETLATNGFDKESNEVFVKAFALVREMTDLEEMAMTICTVSAAITLSKLPLSESAVQDIINTTLKMPQPFRDRALRCSSEILIHAGNIKKAEELADTIENVNERDAAYRELAKHLISKANYAHAIQIIEKISKEEEKACILRYWASSIIE